jgi:3-vinyl bacteriochlorophyllide hydratase
LLLLPTVEDRRNASIWTKIHPVFAIGQLGIFIVSAGLLVLYGLHIVPFTTVYLSVLIKIACMIGAVLTGSFWERDVYGPWWFADEFFIEDVMTVNVFSLHVAAVVAYFAQPFDLRATLMLLVFAYVIYALNVGQYIFRHMSMQHESSAPASAGTRPAAEAEAEPAKTDVAA